tara:strand:+ start:182 stop:535 length:354 start_codon:yes stop_codon:yes gene_type:complete
MDCSICLDTSIENKMITKWICNHKFHEKCIEEWNNYCPNCRCNKLIKTTTKYNNNCFDIDLFLTWAKEIIINNTNYKNQWKNNECITNNHKLTFYKVYGVIGICHDCSIVQSFNYIL